jgi:FkbM family methyltransferase
MSVRFLSKLWKRLRLEMSYYQFPSDRLCIRHVCIGDLQLVLPANEDVGRYIYCWREYEAAETKYLASRLRPHDVCFDLGANFGYYTVLMAKIACRGWIHAFEPNSLSRAFLELNVRLNHLDNVIVNSVAIASIPGRSSFVRASDSGFSSLRDTGRRSVSEVTEVQVMSLDRYTEESAIARIDVMKIDVEGAEGLVVLGAERLLADYNRRPRLIQMELCQENLSAYGDKVRDVAASLECLGYWPFGLWQGKKIPYQSDSGQATPNVFFEGTESGLPKVGCIPCAPEQPKTTVSAPYNGNSLWR